MPRLILSLSPGAQTADARQQALQVANVQDAVEARQSNAVIVSVPEITSATRQELASLPNVEGVFDDLQALPQVADEEAVRDFLQRASDLRGEELPPVIETEPTRPGEPISDGGTAAVLPVETATEATAQPTGPIRSIDDSLDFIGATALHERGFRGANVVSVIVDTGACDSAIRDERQLEGTDLTGEDDPWSLAGDHGGMTSGIMVGDETTPGVDVGALPESAVYPIKTTLAASELMQAQDVIVQLAEQNPDMAIVVNNAWGFPECGGICDHPVTSAVDSAASHDRVHQVVAAGNSAAGITGCGTECDGSTPGISGPNSLDSVITVAASGRNGEPTKIHDYSSRGGPGNVACGRRKPDVSAPIFGTMPWGCSSRDMGNGGGTSAACPLVAGAVGLLADQRRQITTVAANGGLQDTATQFQGGGFNGCSGAGNIHADEVVLGGAGGGDENGTVVAGLSGRGQVSLAAAGVVGGLIGAAIRQRRRDRR